jgi:hypothetical protein
MKEMKEELKKNLIRIMLAVVLPIISGYVAYINGFLSRQPGWSLMVCLSIVFLIVFSDSVWMFLKRTYYRSFKIGLKVGFVIKANECEEYYQEVLSNLRMYTSKVEKLVEFSDLSDAEKITSVKDARNVILKYPSTHLIVWGEFSKKLTKKGRSLHVLRLHFVWQHPENNAGTIAKYMKDHFPVLFPVGYNEWEIFEDDSLSGIQEVSQYIAFCCKYIVAALLRLRGQYEESVSLLSAIDYQKLKSGQAEKVKALIIESICAQVIISYDELDYLKKQGKETTNLLKENIKKCRRALEIDPNHSQALISLAYLEYTLNPDEGIYDEIITKAGALYPKDPTSIANFAFLFIVQKKYSKAYSCYKKLENLNFNAVDTIEHLDSEYERTGNPGFIFGAGYLSYYFGEKLLALNYMEIFLSKANIDNYGHMYSAALRIKKKGQNI